MTIEIEYLQSGGYPPLSGRPSKAMLTTVEAGCLQWQLDNLLADGRLQLPAVDCLQEMCVWFRPSHALKPFLCGEHNITCEVLGGDIHPEQAWQLVSPACRNLHSITGASIQC